MQRARRLALVAVLPLLGVLALAGCRSEPSVAAYVGDKKITVKDVDGVIDDLSSHNLQVNPTRSGDVRQEILADLIFIEFGKRYAEDKGWSAPPSPDPRALQVAAADLRLQVTDVQVVKNHASAMAYLDLLMQHASPVEPTEADLHAIFDRAAGLADAGSFENARPQLANIPTIAPALGLERELDKALDTYSVQVNPLYRSVSYPILKLRAGQDPFDAIVLPLNKTSGDHPVRNS